MNKIDIDEKMKNASKVMDEKIILNPNNEEVIMEEKQKEKKKNHFFFNKRVVAILSSFCIVLIAALIIIPIASDAKNTVVPSSDTVIEIEEDESSFDIGEKITPSIHKGDYIASTDGISGGTILSGGTSSKIGDIAVSPVTGDTTDSTDEKENNQIQAGQLSASAYNDNDYYSFWKSLNDQSSAGMKFYDLNTKYSFSTLHRVEVDLPINLDAKVLLLDSNNQDSILYTAYPNEEGKAYLFSDKKQDTYSIRVEYSIGGASTSKDFTTEVDSDIIDATLISGDQVNNNLIEFMLVLDATGSMGDEMRYLVAELKNIITRVKEDNNNVEFKVSVLVYRDTDDDYVVKGIDFTSDIDEAISFLGRQEASGGGDEPEAIQCAFEEALLKSWSSTTSTKILLHVADAPTHDEDTEKMFASVKKMAALGIRIISLECSSSNTLASYEFRAEALLTNGYYTYLTNDSGIGDAHTTPKTEIMPVVEYVNDMLVRIINGMYSGTYADPVAYNKAN